jgi:diguanylate cyclase
MSADQKLLNEQQQLIQSVTHLKLTLPRMSKLGIPTTPENFSVWYEYSMGTKLELTKAIDDILNNGANFTADINHDLYMRYIADHSHQQIKQMQDNVRTIIDELLEQLHIMTGDMVNFRGALDNCDESLRNDPSIKNVQRLVNCLIEEADLVRDSSVSLETSLTTLNQEVDVLRSDVEKLNLEVSIDELTGIANRRTFDRALAQSIQFYQVSREPFCLMMIDIDHFKTFNDEYGHLVGDTVLAFVAKFIQKGVKGSDTVARYGGEEFTIILPDTAYQGGLTVAEKIRRTVSSKQLTIGDDCKKVLGKISISLGVAEVRLEDTEHSLVKRADAALYQAKNNGRDCVVGEREI